MNKILFALICIGSLIGCSENQNEGPNYTYNWKTKITYLNGDIDTLVINRSSHDGRFINLYLNTNDVPCLQTLRNGYWFDSLIVCGVRRYEILSLEKNLVK